MYSSDDQKSAEEKRREYQRKYKREHPVDPVKRREYLSRPGIKKKYAEAKQRERDRIKADPERYAIYLQKVRERSRQKRVRRLRKIWVRKNRDKINQYAKLWRETNKEHYAAYIRANKDKIAGYTKKWYAKVLLANPDHFHLKWRREGLKRKIRKILALPPTSDSRENVWRIKEEIRLIKRYMKIVK